jgi:hypothetical protein
MSIECTLPGSSRTFGAGERPSERALATFTWGATMKFQSGIAAMADSKSR